MLLRQRLGLLLVFLLQFLRVGLVRALLMLRVLLLLELLALLSLLGNQLILLLLVLLVCLRIP